MTAVDTLLIDPRLSALADLLDFNGPIAYACAYLLSTDKSMTLATANGVIACSVSYTSLSGNQLPPGRYIVHGQSLKDAKKSKASGALRAEVAIRPVESKDSGLIFSWMENPSSDRHNDHILPIVNPSFLAQLTTVISRIAKSRKNDRSGDCKMRIKSNGSLSPLVIEAYTNSDDLRIIGAVLPLQLTVWNENDWART